MDSLKDTLYTPAIIQNMAEQIHSVYPDLSTKEFTNELFSDEWKTLELKQRMRYLTHKLQQFLPTPYESAIEILMLCSKNIRDFTVLSFSDFVEVYGQKNWELSMNALAYFTESCSSEFAIRPFLETDPQRGMLQMLSWSTDTNEHIRRLASEGCRPKLPWGMALKKFIADPSPILPILENLKDDPSEYVRRSVANNLNDISKDHPELVLKTCTNWKGKSKETDWVIKHACRTLLKKGNKTAMLLFGFGDPKAVAINQFAATNATLKIGEQTSFQFQLEIDANEKKKLRIEYRVHFIKASGKSSPKVFQISEKEWEPGKHTIRFKHDFKERTTRKHYAGKHHIDIIVNGDLKASTAVQLTANE